METIENPVIKDTPSLDSFMELAHKADTGTLKPEDVPSADKSEPRATDKTEPESTSSPDTTLETTATTDSRPRDAQGRFTKREDGTDIPEAERQPAEQPKPDSSNVAKADAKPESAYQKAQKEAERRDRSWKQLEEEKERVRGEAQRLEQERQQWLYEREQAQQRNGTQDRQQQYTSQDYADFADECTRKAEEARKAGDYEEAEKHITLAARASKAALESVKHETVAQQQTYQQQMLEHLRYDADEAMRREPELQDRNSPLGQETSRVLEEFGPIIDQIPVTRLSNGKTLGGFSIAVEVAKLRRQAGAASGLEEENKKLKEQVKELNSKLSIGGSGPTSQAPERKTFDQMPASQAMDEIERRAAQMAA